MEDNIVPLVLAGSVLITVFAFFLIGFLVVHKSRQARARRKLAEYENRLLQTRIEVQESAARSISAELHDGVGAMLSHIKMQLQFLTETEDERDWRPELIPLYNDLGSVISDLRSISHNLNGDMIGRMGLMDALRKEVESVKRSGKMDAVLHITGEPQLSREQELLLFRIAQEAIANAVKHSGGTFLNVALRREATRLVLSISDNGRGMGERAGVVGKDSTQGMGMMSMAERVTMLRGTLEVSPADGGGTVVMVSV